MGGLIGKEYSGLIHLVHCGKERIQTKVLDASIVKSPWSLRETENHSLLLTHVNVCIRAGSRLEAGGGWVVVGGLAAGMDCVVLEPDFEEDFLAMVLSVTNEGVVCLGVEAAVVVDTAGVTMVLAATVAREELGGKAGAIVNQGKKVLLPCL